MSLCLLLFKKSQTCKEANKMALKWDAEDPSLAFGPVSEYFSHFFCDNPWS